MVTMHLSSQEWGIAVHHGDVNGRLIVTALYVRVAESKNVSGSIKNDS